MENKYIITLEEIPFERFHSYNVPSERLYRVQGFNSLVFDGNGLSKLTPYTEPDTNEAYQRGVEDGAKSVENWNAQEKKLRMDEAYQKGLSDAWDAARKIESLSAREFDKAFAGYDDCFKVFENYTPQEAIEKIKQCGQKQEEIEYGDEIQFCDGVKALVLDVDDEKLSVVTKRGFTDISMWKGNVTKTGEKYITIADYLRKIRDGYEF